MPKLVIYVNFQNEDDLENLKQSCIGSVEFVIDEHVDGMAGDAEVSWDVEDA